MKNTIPLGTALGILLAGAATAQGGTDDCVAPTILPGEGSYTFDTTNTQESSD
ncbi:MAG: hypothetical protein GY930_10715, partial [bacterium]|nr:hypothetical protein [bacterium]